MAEKKQAAQAAQAAQPLPKFEISALREHCTKVLGVTAAAFDGAMYGKTGQYTVAEAKEIVTRWLKKPVGGFGKGAR